MTLPGTDYELKTTFWMDFTIADAFGTDAVQDTFNRAFSEWKTDHIYLTELVMVLNHKSWQHHRTNRALCNLYADLYWKAAGEAETTLTGDALRYYLNVTD